MNYDSVVLKGVCSGAMLRGYSLIPDELHCFIHQERKER
jgi:hypothetical protein